MVYRTNTRQVDSRCPYLLSVFVLHAGSMQMAPGARSGQFTHRGFTLSPTWTRAFPRCTRNGSRSFVDLVCPRCGKLHGVYGGLWGGLLILNGPDHAGTIAELYEGQELPGVLVRLMNDTPWCDQVEEYVPRDDPARAHLTPKNAGI